VLGRLTGLSGSADLPPEPSPPPPIETLIAEIDTPELREAGARAEAARATRPLARAGMWPVVAASGSLTYLEPAPGFGDDVSWRLMLGAQIPLYQGGAVAARADQADARVAQAEAAERVLREAAEVKVIAARGALDASLVTLGGHAEAVRLAREAVTAAEARVKGGSATLLELQQSESTLAEAEFRQAYARSEASMAKTRLQIAMTGGVGAADR
jgi:outer membrane protein TolC